MGIEHVYDSRSIEFAERIRRDTDGYGVDIVLNSVTGAAQRAGIELLAFGGRFVEIGKRDIYGDTRLGLFPFRRNLTFYAVDLALLSYSHPAPAARLVEHGVPAHRGRCAADAGEHALPACRRRHRHSGDERRPAHRQTRARRPAHRHAAAWWCRRRRLRSSAATAPTSSPVGWAAWGCSWPRRWPTAGCGRIVLSSRSQPTPEALETIERIRAIGADVVVECGDIAEAGTAQRLVAAATATGLPVRGVLHAAAVVEDATLTNITDELIERDWAPKVYGAWNLHTATAGQPLDWFCSFSSAAALVGSPGQGAYAAANSWLDAFTLWRRAQGLPATAIAWGAWAQIGRATALAEGADDCHRSRRGRLRVRSAAAPRPRLHRLRAHHGHPVVDRLRPAQSLRRSVPLHRAKRSGHKQTACRARRAAPGRVAHPAAASDLRPGQPDPASQHRSRPAALRVRHGLAGRPRTAHPHRDRNGNTHQSQPTSPPSAPFAVWRDCCAKSWPLRKPPDMHVPARPQWSVDSKSSGPAHATYAYSVECHLTEQRWAVPDERNVSDSTACAAAI